jgi:hypothetical protein
MGTLGRAAAEMHMKKLTYIGSWTAVSTEHLNFEMWLVVGDVFHVAPNFGLRDGASVSIGPGCSIR